MSAAARMPAARDEAPTRPPSSMNAPRQLLRGITWDHPRGHAPLQATARLFAEQRPDIGIVWEKRSLRGFEEAPLEQLAADYDLLVIDHPFVGQAARQGCLLPLDEHLPAEFLAEQAAHPVGPSHASYRFGGHQWALAIDAAAPVAFWRVDLLRHFRAGVPPTWEDVLALARSGHVEIPAAPINCLMNFFAFCLALGEAPFSSPGRVVSAGTGRDALGRLRELLAHCDPGCRNRNPIASHDLLASAENQHLAYCPLAYGYSNYARAGFAAHRLTFGEPPAFGGSPLRTVLGGAGLALSARRPRQPAALAYAPFVASPEIQRTLYTASGGQPGHRDAWLDLENNRLSGGYFIRTLPALDRAWMRPRHAGYGAFQRHAAAVVHAALFDHLTDTETLTRLNDLHRAAPETP